MYTQDGRKLTKNIVPVSHLGTIFFRKRFGVSLLVSRLKLGKGDGAEVYYERSFEHLSTLLPKPKQVMTEV